MYLSSFVTNLLTILFRHLYFANSVLTLYNSSCLSFCFRAVFVAIFLFWKTLKSKILVSLKTMTARHFLAKYMLAALVNMF